MIAHRLIELALAQGTPAPAPGVGQFANIGMIALMFAVFYFLLIRPANKQRREHAELLNQLKKDDEIVTSGGMWGRIVSLDDKVATVEIADKVKVRMLRDRIAGKWPSAKPAEAPAATDKLADKKS
jgi:preprotein translocase subunit YajC